MSSIFRTNNRKYWTTFAAHGEHRDGEIVFFSSENPYLVTDRGEGPGVTGPSPLIFRPNWGPKDPLIPASGWSPPPPCLKVWIRHWYLASQHNERIPFLVCEKFMAQHRRVMMATNKASFLQQFILHFTSALCLISYSAIEITRI